MSSAYLVTVTVHVLAALIWLGGLFFWLGRLNAMVGLLLVVAAVRLART